MINFGLNLISCESWLSCAANNLTLRAKPIAMHDHCIFNPVLLLLIACDVRSMLYVLSSHPYHHIISCHYHIDFSPPTATDFKHPMTIFRTYFVQRFLWQEFVLGTVVKIYCRQSTYSVICYLFSEILFSLTVPFTCFHLILCNTGLF